MTTPAVRLVGLEKAYSDFELGGIDLELPEGSVMGLIGPNGAGKSTTMRILVGLVRQDRGEAIVLGRSMPSDQVAVKRDVGFASEDMRLYAQASIRWHMDFVRSIHPGWDEAYATSLLKRFDLQPHHKVKGLSHGQRVKATLLLALAHRPRLLILDEPTVGLDPVARHEVLGEFMDVLSDSDRSILFSSQITQDVEQISDVIAFIDRGRLIESRDKESYLDSWRRLRLEVPASASLPDLEGLVYGRGKGALRVATTNRFEPAMTQAFERAGVTVQGVESMTLEEIFLATVQLSRGVSR
jgi:ABC-2 type transport system ATP-binding protein